jgi:predicted nucleic acid-binding protein
MILDTNVAVHWFVATEFSSAAGRFRDRNDLAAPSFILVEAANTLYTYSRRGTIDPRHCARSVTLLEYQLREIVPNEHLLTEAIRLALANQHPVYDCLYLALALQRREPLATADRRLAALAGTIGVEVALVEPT